MNVIWNEQQIVEQLHDVKRREQAFTMLVDHFKEQLYWQIRRMVLSHDDADDVLQNTFIKAWTGLEGFRGDSKLSTWLFRIANNETLNFLERKRQALSIDDEAAVGVAARLESDPYFDGDETERQLQEAIAQLPAKQRQVFNLKYFDEMKYEEMSDLLGTSVGALKASYHHAVKKISDFFNRHD
ncbi:MAG: sigma-70 family RNA polymerase sigma factor [Bacteroidaceae bacterium]|nr:sigma-70 family RNA polymerase sigma factor [Bacteroidaceae bacterium]